MKIAFTSPRMPQRGALVVAAFDDGQFDDPAQRADEASGGALARAVAASRFTGKPNQDPDTAGAVGPLGKPRSHRRARDRRRA